MTKFDLSWPPVADVVRFYGGQPSDRKALWNVMRCPFHEDRSASAAINRQENIFYCFACGISTTGLGLIMKQEGLKIAEARKFAGERFGGGDQPLRAEPASGNPLFGGSGDRSGNSGKVPPGGSQHPLFGP